MGHWFFESPINRRVGVRLPLHYPADAGAGAGGAASGASSSDGTGAGAGAGTTGAATPYQLTDDSLVIVEAGKPPVRWGDHRASTYMPKSQYDEGVKFLMKVAEGFDAQRGNVGQRGNVQQQQQQPGRQQQQQQPPADPFAAIEDQPVIDGRTLAKIGREMMQQGFGPIGQLMTQIATRLTALEGNYKTTAQQTGSLAEHHQSRQFEDFITTNLKTVPEIKGLGMVNPDQPAIRELAKDIYLSHDQKDPLLEKEFGKMLSERLTSMFTLFTQMQRDAVKNAQDTARRKFTNPNRGAGAGTGGSKYVHQTGAELAHEFFAGQQGSQT